MLPAGNVFPDHFYAIRGSRYYNLTDGIAYLGGIDGMGLPGVNRISEHGPLQDGVTDIGFRLPPRNLTLVLTLPAHCFYFFRELRQNFLDAFKPSNAPIKLLVEFAVPPIYTIARQLDVHNTGGLTLPSDGVFAGNGMVGIRDTAQLYAPDPTWYNPAIQQVGFNTSVIGGLIFPITFPIVFGTQTIGVAAQVTYSGTWKTYPLIYLTGPMQNPQVSNLTTGEHIKLNYTIAAGEMVTIDTRYGYKTIYNNVGTNLLYALADGGNLATFHIAADDEAAGGVNELFADGDGLTSASSVVLQWYDRFIGV